MATIRLSRIRAEQRPFVGVAISGPSYIAVGSNAVYTITDYDSFSTYSVKSSIGTATIDRDKITVAVPSTTLSSQMTLDVKINNINRAFIISLRAGSIISAPVITSPVTDTAGVSNNLTLQASAYTSIPANSLPATASEWVIALDAQFASIAAQQTVTTAPYSFFTANLSSGTKYYARMRYLSNAVTSDWSPVVGFTTTSISIQKPTLSTQNGQTTNIGMNFTVIGSAFSSTPTNSETHVSSTWIVKEKITDAVALEVPNSSVNKLSISIPISDLKTSTEYSIEAKYNGQVAQSPFSDKLMITTASQFIPTAPGTPFGGGYYVGRINIAGVIYALIAAPKTSGETQLQWCTDNIAGPYGLNDGVANTNELARSAELFPVAKWVKGLSIGGYRDWYIPSVDELELCYRQLKPTSASNLAQASGGPRGAMGYNPSSVPSGAAYTSTSPGISSSTLFRSTGAQALRVDIPYWTSSYASGGAGGVGRAYTQEFNYGAQVPVSENASQMVRAVRRVRVS